MKKKWDRRLRQHDDMGAILRQAQKDLAAQQQVARRIAEVDSKEYQTPVFDVPLLAVERSDGTWQIETTTTVFPSQKGKLSVAHRNKNIAICDLRQVLRERLIEDRYTRDQDEARRIAALANVWIAGNVPFHRIVSK